MQACVLSLPLTFSQPDSWQNEAEKISLSVVMKHHHIICKWANCAHSISNLLYRRQELEDWCGKVPRSHCMKMYKHYCEWNALQQVTDQYSPTGAIFTLPLCLSLGSWRRGYFCLCWVDKCRRGHAAQVIRFSWCRPKWVWLTLLVAPSCCGFPNNTGKMNSTWCMGRNEESNMRIVELLQKQW